MRRRAFGVWCLGGNLVQEHRKWQVSRVEGRHLDEQNRGWYRLPSHAYMQYYIQSFRKKVDWISVVI
jgi:hypothetical protein